jgi:hypothetical protein
MRPSKLEVAEITVSSIEFSFLLKKPEKGIELPTLPLFSVFIL